MNILKALAEWHSKRRQDCPRCHGSGERPVRSYSTEGVREHGTEPCRTCNGRGTVTVVPDNEAVVKESKMP